MPVSAHEPLPMSQHVAARLAAFKVPVQVWFVDEPLPRNPAGKLLNRQLHHELVDAD